MLNNVFNHISSIYFVFSALQVLVLCFAVFLGSWTPHSFLNSGHHLPKLFSSPLSSPSNDMPHPYFGSYDNNDQYSSLHAHNDDDDDNDDVMTDSVFGLYGPRPNSESEDEDPYTTYSSKRPSLFCHAKETQKVSFKLAIKWIYFCTFFIKRLQHWNWI